MTQESQLPADPASTFPAPTSIRVETALTRYPMHRLARKGNVEINIREVGKDGQETRWEVDYSKKHGQPGPLAYKIDTLIINRRIEEARRPIPRLIRLGSLKEMCRELDMAETGGNTNQIKNALTQNAFAGITAKTLYRQSDGSEQTLEAAFTRYSVILTGEKLPNGKKADCVYVMLNDIFMNVINGAMTRPLDYDYLKSLPPAPQRFYELLSYQMYAALKHDRPRAKLIYSDFCAHAPQTRHVDWERVRSQMNKVHRPHKESGYIAKVDFQQTTDSADNPDWIMLYMPGPKARAEFRAFTKRGGPEMLEIEPLEPIALDAPKVSELEAKLIRFGVSAETAAELVRQHGEEKIGLQMEVLTWRLSRKSKHSIDDPAAYLVIAIKNDHPVPKNFVSEAQRERQAEAKKAKEHTEAEVAAKKMREDAEKRRVEATAKAYLEQLSPAERAQLDAQVIAQASPETLADLESMGVYRATGLIALVRDYVKQQIANGTLTMPTKDVCKPS